MSANTIAKANLQVGLDQKEMEQKLDRLPATVDDKLSKVDMGGKGSGIGSLLGAGIAGGIAGALATAGLGAIKAGIETIVGFVTSGIDRIQELGQTTDFAAALGYTPEALSRVQGITEKARVSGDLAVKSLAKLDETARKAMEGDESSKTIFDNLGLSAENFLNVPIDDKLFMLADALKNSEDKIGTNIALMDIFGEKAGAKLIGVLSKSNEQLEMLAGHGGKSAEELTKLATATDAMDDLFGQLEDTTDALLIQIAPFLESCSDAAMTILPSVTDAINQLGEVAGPIFKQLVLFGADVFDIWLKLEGGVETLQTKFEIFATIIEATIMPLVKAAQWLAEQIAGDDGSSRQKVEGFFSEMEAKREERAKASQARIAQEEKNRIEGNGRFAIKAREKVAAKEAEELAKSQEKEMQATMKIAEEQRRIDEALEKQKMKALDDYIKAYEDGMKYFQDVYKHTSRPISAASYGSQDVATLAANNRGGNVSQDVLRRQLEIQKAQLEQLRKIAGKEEIKLGVI